MVGLHVWLIMRARDVHNGRGEQNTRGPSVTKPLKGASPVLRFNGIAASLSSNLYR